MWPLAALSRWLPYRGKIYSKMHWGDLRVAAMDRWPPYGGGREGRFDCIYKLSECLFLQCSDYIQPPTYVPDLNCWVTNANTKYGLLHFILESFREREMFYFIYGYIASDIWLRTIVIVRKETRCRHIGYSYRLTARFLLYAPSHRQDNTYHGLCYTSRGTLA